MFTPISQAATGRGASVWVTTQIGSPMVSTVPPSRVSPLVWATSAYGRSRRREPAGRPAPDPRQPGQPQVEQADGDRGGRVAQQQQGVPEPGVHPDRDPGGEHPEGEAGVETLRLYAETRTRSAPVTTAEMIAWRPTSAPLSVQPSSTMTARKAPNERTWVAATSSTAWAAVRPSVTARGPARSASRPTRIPNGSPASPAADSPSPTWTGSSPTDRTK